MAKQNNEHIIKVKLIREASKSLKDYNDLLAKTKEINENQLFIDSQRVELLKQLKELEAEKQLLITNGAKITDQEVIDISNRIDKRKKEIDIIDVSLKKNGENLRIHREATKEVKLSALYLKSMLGGAVLLGKELKRHTPYLIEQQKGVKLSELSMGILSNQANGFRQNLYKTSLVTTELGVNTKMLAKIQGDYSDNIGRSVQLSEEQMVSMAELAKGTMMGAEGAAQFAADMDNFNISAKGSAKFIENTLKDSHKLGVNSAKVIKNIQTNIGIAQKFNFKGGIAGLTKMANLATKFKFEMQSIANFAENLITPEGAVEAAAKLQVLGGAWAKLGDPFQLMYRSRNDLAGLTEDIINATKATARFDEATGEVMIDPMELHRLREVANATGLDFDSLAQSAKEAAKFAKIEGGLSNIFNKEDKVYLSSLASFNKEKGEFEITMQTKDGTVTESVNALRKITPEMVKSQKEYTQTLEKNAKQALTFDETWRNLQETFKSVLLPGFEGFASALQRGLTEFSDWARDNKIFEKMANIGKGIGDFVSNWPKMTTALIGLAMFGKEAWWIARGALLRLGFDRAGKHGIGDSSPWSKGTKGSAVGRMKAGGRMGAGIGGRMGALGGVMAGGLAGYNEWTSNSEMGMDRNENLGRTSLVGVGGIAGGALGGAAIGALGGPLAPVTVPLGALIGAGLGAWGGDVLGDSIWGETGSNQPTSSGGYDDFISRPGENPIHFNSGDSLIGAKVGGPIDKLLNNSSDQNVDAVRDNKIIIEFKSPLKVEGKFDLLSNGQSSSFDLTDPILMRELSKAIQEDLGKTIGGGKNSSTPPFA